MFTKAHQTWIVVLLLMSLLIGGWVGAQSANSRTDGPVVIVAQIDGTIDLGLAPFVDRVMRQAQADNVAAVVLQINTFGGRVDAAVQIRDALLKSPVTSIAFIDTRAISAGALISLAANVIVMAPGGTIGAATPVISSGAETQPTSEKTVSYVRKEFSATAESRGRDPLVAEAMVDTDVVIPGVTARGKLLTLTTEEALKLDIADFEAATVQSVLEQLGMRNAQIIEASTNWGEEVVRFLTNPIVSSLLVSLAMIGIIVEVRTPGFGIPGAVGISSLGLFIWGHWIVNLVGLEELLLLAAGIGLLLIEAFVLPGFGIAGILGILALLAAVIMSTVGDGVSTQGLIAATSRFGLSLLVALVASAVMLRYLPKTKFGRQLVLETDLSAATGYTSERLSEHELVGKEGVASSTLRPSGVADIEGKRIDVVSDGEFIDPGERIRVDHVDGNRVVVRRIV